MEISKPKITSTGGKGHKKISKHNWKLPSCISHYFALWIGVLFFLIVLTSYFLNFGISTTSETWLRSFSNSNSDWGTFGDYIGGLLNPMLGLVTVWLLLKNLHQNNQMLKQAADELELTRNEIERGLEIQNNTKSALDKQIFLSENQHKIDNIFNHSSRFSDYLKESLNSSSCRIDAIQTRQLYRKLYPNATEGNLDLGKDLLKAFIQRISLFFNILETQKTFDHEGVVSFYNSVNNHNMHLHGIFGNSIKISFTNFNPTRFIIGGTVLELNGGTIKSHTESYLLQLRAYYTICSFTFDFDKENYCFDLINEYEGVIMHIPDIGEENQRDIGRPNIIGDICKQFKPKLQTLQNWIVENE